MNPEEIINKEWDKFLKWLYKEKHIAPDLWIPDCISIKLWLEFKGGKK